MAQSIKLGNDIFIAASGVDGNKGIITSGDDLDNYWGPRNAGLWVVNATASDVSNCPLSYCGLIVIALGQSGANQLAFSSSGIFKRSKVGATPTWTEWKSVTGGRVVGTASNISFGASGYVSLTNIYDAGVPQGATVTGVGIRGWNGASDTPISLALSNDGNTLYAMGVKNATVSNIGYFISYTWI